MARQQIPRDVQKRILKRCAKGKPVVVVAKGGTPSRVFDLDTYLSTVETARRVKPWKQRERKESADPLGAVPGRVLTSLSRSELYD